MNSILEDLRADLFRNSNEKDRLAGQRFFKEEVNLLGMKAAVVTAIAKEHYRNITDKSKSSIFYLCDELFASGIMEESFVACNWSYNVHMEYELTEFGIFEKWVNKYINNWATCDTLCNHTVGTLVEMYPELIIGLKRWARSENRWVKRASAVSLIVPGRKGLFLEDIFEIAETLLRDTDDMVQKGYGWMLKVASQTHQKEVFEFVLQRKLEMPRTALRDAIEKMPEEMKREAMKKS
jgi:3-methyladenine DNA glycosylase AlkD